MKKIVPLILCLIVLNVCNLVALHPCFGEEWIVEVVSVEPGVMEQGKWVPKALFRNGENMCFKVTAINRSPVSRDVKITITVYDSVNQPIGYDEKVLILLPETTQTVYLSITIPSWAATGKAVAYVNAFQVIEGLPIGLPYCPETSTNLAIYNEGGARRILRMPA